MRNALWTFECGLMIYPPCYRSQQRRGSSYNFDLNTDDSGVDSNFCLMTPDSVGKCGDVIFLRMDLLPGKGVSDGKFDSFDLRVLFNELNVSMD